MCQHYRVVGIALLRNVLLLVGIILVLVVLLDSFETIILPRTVSRGNRLTSLMSRMLWRFWRGVSRLLRGDRRESWLAAFGPLNTIFLIFVWAIFQIVGFGMIHFGLATPIADHPKVLLEEYFFFSGGNFFTVGSSFVATTHAGQFLSVLESGLGFAFLGLVIGYVPVIAQQFGQREAQITLFDARAGSPSTAYELYKRYAENDDLEAITPLLAEWEKWCAELLQSFMSYPILAWYRSQHDAQSWLSAVTTVLDTCSLAQLGIDESLPSNAKLVRQAKLTFAISRHVIIDLALILHMPVKPVKNERLSHEQFLALRDSLANLGVTTCSEDGVEEHLRELRMLYEPYLHAIGETLMLEVPPFRNENERPDNWQTSAFKASEHFTLSR